jgi:hypothetical protein
MKKLNYFFLFVLIGVLISGCSEIETNQDLLNPGNDSELKKAKVPIPAKCWLTSVPDFSHGNVLCTPESFEVAVVAGGAMKGHEAHGGKLDTEKSTWEVVRCDFDYEKMKITEYIEGKHTVMNGNYYLYEGVLSVSTVDGSIDGVVNAFGGVGKFEGGTAEVNITGFLDFDTGIATMKGEGYWNFSD